MPYELIFIVLGFVTVAITAGVAGKGCNDSDNKVYSEAIAKGCSVTYVEHNGRQILCPPLNEKGFAK